MVQSWRQRGGWLKDIPAYVFNVNRCKPRASTLQALASLGCHYIEHHIEDAEKLECGFLNEPLCGKIAEEMLSEDIFIKIDLDMQLLKPLSQALLDIGDFTLVGQYSDEDAKAQRHGFAGFAPFDTNFIVSSRQSKFYHHYCEACFSKEYLDSDEYKRVMRTDGVNSNYYQEEFAVDYLHKNGICKIKPVLNYNFGEGYHDIDSMTDAEVESVHFLHGHICKDHTSDFDEAQCKLKYMKRMCRINQRYLASSGSRRST